MGRVTVEAVLLDAMGTLVRLDPPAPRLRGALVRARRDLAPPTLDQAATAIAAEIAHYRANIARGRDAEGLAGLRRECAGVLRAALPSRFADLPDDTITRVLLDSLRFSAYPDAVPALEALRDRGIRIGVVSNWDASLDEMLESTGLAPYIDVAIASAVLGAEKPDPTPFRAALDALGVDAGAALHAGDDIVADLDGAAAAGIRAVLIDRVGARSNAAPPLAPPTGADARFADVPVLPSLSGLAGLCG